jgi:AcrR family transcriptional regulator
MQSRATAEEGERREEGSKRTERAHRILDAAASLMLRYGYRKTTVDDIARVAGVAKGTIYLHWKTREDLFSALMLRESVESSKQIWQRVDNDPEAFYLSKAIKHSMEVILTRPLSRALFLQDQSILGEIMQNGWGGLDVLAEQKIKAFTRVLEFFRSRGALRLDQSLETQIKLFSAITMGVLLLDPYMPAEYRNTPEEAAQLVSIAIHETMEPVEPVAPENLSELKMVFNTLIKPYLDMVEERLKKELE